MKIFLVQQVLVGISLRVIGDDVIILKHELLVRFAKFVHRPLLQRIVNDETDVVHGQMKFDLPGGGRASIQRGLRNVGTVGCYGPVGGTGTGRVGRDCRGAGRHSTVMLPSRRGIAGDYLSGVVDDEGRRGGGEFVRVDDDASVRRRERMTERVDVVILLLRRRRRRRLDLLIRPKGEFYRRGRPLRIESLPLLLRRVVGGGGRQTAGAVERLGPTVALPPRPRHARRPAHILGR
mmetsp:Transcript_51532/g.154714  ORF Transcript_51532/g.154714 Transcript_51532/m.154714 type:complete len:235 (-) Transcript_51532:70-774(-)